MVLRRVGIYSPKNIFKKVLTQKGACDIINHVADEAAVTKNSLKKLLKKLLKKSLTKRKLRDMIIKSLEER